MSPVRLKRAYDPPAPDDGVRVLVDRLWPRGLKRETAKIDLWVKDVAPSGELRRWFGHDRRRWDEFRGRYRSELAALAEPLAALRDLVDADRPVTLLFAAKDEAHNNAVVLKEVLDRP